MQVAELKIGLEPTRTENVQVAELKIGLEPTRTEKCASCRLKLALEPTRTEKNVVNKYPEGKTVMVLDNARIHHAKLLQPSLDQQAGKLELMFLPPYSPELNIVEGLWGWLKQSVIHNVFFSTTNEIRIAVKSFMNEISKDRMNIIDRLCIRM